MVRTMILGTLLVCLLSVSICHGQTPGFRGRGSRMPLGINLVLISLPEIQEELRVDSEQVKFLEALQQDLVTQMRNRTRSLDDEARRGRSEVAERIWKVLLSEEQAVRFEQVKLQFDGLYAIDRAEFAKELELTDQQQADIRRLRANGNPVEVTSVLDPILSTEQLDKWKEKLGDTFSFDEDTLEFREAYHSRGRFGRRGSARGRTPGP